MTEKLNLKQLGLLTLLLIEEAKGNFYTTKTLKKKLKLKMSNTEIHQLLGYLEGLGLISIDGPGEPTTISIGKVELHKIKFAF